MHIPKLGCLNYATLCLRFQKKTVTSNSWLLVLSRTMGPDKQRAQNVLGPWHPTSRVDTRTRLLLIFVTSQLFLLVQLHVLLKYSACRSKIWIKYELCMIIFSLLTVFIGYYSSSRVAFNKTGFTRHRLLYSTILSGTAMLLSNLYLPSCFSQTNASLSNYQIDL